MPTIKITHQRKFYRIAAQMDALLKEIREYCPEANLYVEDSGNWCLLTGDSHDYVAGSLVARRDRMVARADVTYSGGGGW